MPVNDTNIQAGADEMHRMLDAAKTQQQAEVVADRLRADFMDCMSQGEEGRERWGHIAVAMRYGDQKGKGYDVQVNCKGDLPVITLVDSQQGFENPFTGNRIGGTTLVINEDHSEHKGVTAHGESGATPRQVRPIEMK